MPAPTILIVGTCDTKAAELAFMADAIRALGGEPSVMDVGVLEDPVWEPDIPAAAVAKAAGRTLAELRAHEDRQTGLSTMGEGAAILSRAMADRNEIAGVIAAGGAGNATVALAAMRELPLGFPKVLVSTLAAGDTRSLAGDLDLTLVHPIVDIASLNRVLRPVLWNACAAVVGMARAPYRRVAEQEGRAPEVIASMFGVTTPCVTRAAAAMRESGYEVLVFHATGAGGRNMERAIEKRRPAAVLDVTTTEWVDEVLGGVCAAGAERLTAAARLGIPQVVAPGALDVCNFGPVDHVPARYRGRLLHRHSDTVTLMRTSGEELTAVARAISDRLNQATGPVTVCLPLNGLSDLDRPGQPFHDPTADQALFTELKRSLSSSIHIVDAPLHINDPRFADLIVSELQALVGQRARQPIAKGAI